MPAKSDEPSANKSHPYFKLAKDQHAQHSGPDQSDHPAPLPSPGNRLTSSELEAETGNSAEQAHEKADKNS
jgi:hypothetical protein